MRDWFICN